MTLGDGSESVSRLFMATLLITKDGRIPACAQSFAGVSRARSTAYGRMEGYALSTAT